MLDLDLQKLREVHERCGSIVRQTPLLPLPQLADDCGADEVHLKAECLQATGSFKLRGATAKLATATGVTGVTAGSAGNHGLALAYTARRLGVPCEIHMPANAPVSKVGAIQRLGAVVVQEESSVDACVERAREQAESRGLLFVHPFDDPRIIEGNGGVGLEIVEALPEVAMAVVPIGGGGLASGLAAAIKLSHPGVKVVGVQAEACAPIANPAQARPEGAIRTIADGIAIKRPSALTRELLEHWVDEVVVVDEDAIAEAVVYLAENAKLVAEGAGAVGVAALLTGVIEPAAAGPTVVVISGGNIDPSVMAAVISRHESRAGRRVRLSARVPDHPGGLASLLQTIADAGGNLIEVTHVRESIGLAVDQTGVELVLETRGPEHYASIRKRLEAAGYMSRDSDA
jgi:threonine dehydratase